MSRAYRAFVETDAMLVEINPLIVTPEGELRALDSKYTVDDNALFKHPDIAAMRDLDALDPQERMARERGVTYVKLDGTVGILGNGAGLVMSTLDVVAGAGGAPANFLDVGGGAQADEIVTAMEVLLSDAKVKAVLFNVFGGITRCDEVARGVLTALERLDVQVPIVVRLDGTNDDEGRAILAEAAEPARGRDDAGRGRAGGRPGGSRVAWPSSSVPTPGLWCRASQAVRAASTRPATETTAPRWWPGSRPERRGRR
jgi:succinyl-CoA synthetase beta subunit